MLDKFLPRLRSQKFHRSGTYTPTFCRYVKHLDDFDQYLERCGFSITYGGITVLEALVKRKLMVAVAISSITGNDQFFFLFHGGH